MNAALGMNSATGSALADLDHIRQSIRDIITTPIGSRVMRRDYGSIVPRLIDQPSHPANRLRVMSAVYSAVHRWEDRVRLTGVRFDIGIDGKATIDLDAVRVDGPQATTAISLAIPI